jgi:7-carboxy-7-deazaguanine synthase
MRINEIFLSCQGEGLNVGLPTIFVRFQGCNLNPGCAWCDTKYAQKDDGEEFTVKQVVAGCFYALNVGGRFCITGGEPLYQKQAVVELVRELQAHDVEHIEIFTNGTLPPPLWSTDVQWCVDVKCPSSKVNIDINGYVPWFRVLRHTDSVKFVVTDEADLNYCLTVIKYVRGGGPQILVSPAICGDVVPVSVKTILASQTQQKWMQRVWGFCVQNDLRFSLQNHKVLYGNRKGV